MVQKRFKAIWGLPGFAFLFLLFSIPASAKFPSNSTINFRPSLDGSKYLYTEQSQGLYSGGFNFGLNTNYAFEPVEVVPSSGGARAAGVIDDLLTTHVLVSVGVTDWLNVGLDIPIVFYETFYNFIVPDGTLCTAGNECAKTSTKKMGDVLFAPKIRLLDSDRSIFGIAVSPFVMFPTGSGRFNTGYGQFTGGGKLILDVHFNHKFYLALNVGFQSIKRKNYTFDTPHSVINDIILYSAAANVPLGRDFSLIADIFGETLVESPFSHEIQNPLEILGAVRWAPGDIKRWNFTIGGGGGVTRGWGSPGYRLLAQANYRKSKTVVLDEDVEVETPFEEKIVIVQKIHFEFDRWNIRPISFPILNDVVAVLVNNPQIRLVRIEGHTDWVGSDAYNMRLSQKRAQSVKTYLVNKGIDSNRLTTTGYGESRPIADNNTTLGRAKNRRTEFSVMTSAPIP